MRLCCLCCKFSTSQYQHLRNCLGGYNEIYEVLIKYFDPQLVSERINSKSSEEAIICQNCWLHFNRFHNFQQTIFKMRKLLHQWPQESPLSFQAQEEHIVTVISDDYNVKLETPLEYTCIQRSPLYIKEEEEHELEVFNDDYNTNNTECKILNDLNVPVKTATTISTQNSFATEERSSNESPREKLQLKKCFIKNHLEISYLEGNFKIFSDIARTSLNIANSKKTLLYENCFPSEENSTAAKLNKDLKSGDLKIQNNLKDKFNLANDNKDDKPLSNLGQTLNTSDTGREIVNEVQNKKMKNVYDKLDSTNDKNSHCVEEHFDDTENDDFIADLKPELECDVCSEIFSNFTLLEYHFKDKHDADGYVKCCNKKFYHRFTLIKHIRMHNVNTESQPENARIFKHKRKMKAQVKREQFADDKNVQRNKKSVKFDQIIAEWKPQLECDICSAAFPNFKLLNCHFKDTHKVLAYVRCCNNIFRTRYTLTQHIPLHFNPDMKCYTDVPNQNGKFSCDECGKSLKNPECLKRHKKACHTDDYKYKFVCDECGKELSSSTNLKRHKQTRHTNIKFPCDECGKELANPSTLKGHKETYHSDSSKAKFPCTVCGKELSSRGSLRCHKEMFHTDDYKPKFSCDKCGKQMRRLISLKQHNEICHSDDSTVFICSVCGKVSYSERRLLLHRKYAHEKKEKQTKKKIRKCPHCDKVFNYSACVREHIARYHKKKPMYLCAHCPRSFHSCLIYRKHYKEVHLINHGVNKVKKKIDYTHVKKIAII